MLYLLILTASILISSNAYSHLLVLPYFITYPVGVIAALILWWLNRRRAGLVGYATRLGATALAGLLWGCGQISLLVHQQLPPQWDGSQWQANVLITREGREDETSRQFRGQVLQLDCNQQPCPSLLGQSIAFSWYKAPPLALGQEWRVTIKLRRLQGFANPSGFDFHAQQLAQGLIARASVRQGVLVAEHEPDWTGRLRQHLLSLLNRQDNGQVAYGRFYRALALGDTSALDWHDWQVLQHTGTVHLMAISGFQVGMMAGLGYGLGLILGRGLNLFNRNSGVMIIRLCPWCLSIICAWFYTALANYAVPAQRALVAVVLLNSALALGWRPGPLRVLAWSLVWAAMTEPLVGLNPGFWLSYLATLALIAAVGLHQGIKRWWLEALHAQWAVTIALLLPLFLLQLSFSLSAPITNLIVAPLISVVITPGVFMALAASLVGLESQGLQVLDQLYGPAWAALVWASDKLPNLWWPAKSLDGVDIAIGIIATLLLLLPASLRLRPLAVLLGTMVLWAPAPPKPALDVTVMDVGQGLAVVISTPNHTLLYDTGPSYSAQFDAGTGILLPFFIGEGIRRTDVILSRDAKDHSGGLRGLANNFQLDQIWVGEAIASQPHAPRCLRGQRWSMDDVKLQVLWPPLNSTEYGGNRACVLLLSLGEEAILITGDIDKSVEYQLIKAGDLPSQVRLLVAPNHGSPISSSPAFLQAISPQWSIFSTGRHNPYHQPNVKVVKRYESLGFNTFNTAETGAVRLQWQHPKQEPSIELERIARPKPWYD